MTRGIRNNNPGNIVKSGTAWAGKVPHELNEDRRFEKFETMHHGVLAVIRLLWTYYSKRGLRSVHDIMARYAPSHENDTSGYVRWVSRQVGIHPKATLSWTEKRVKPLVTAILRKESGYKLTDEDWSKAWALTQWGVQKKSPLKLLEDNQVFQTL